METNVVKVSAEDIVISNPQELATSQPQTSEELLNLFVAEQDVKESSRALYRRTLALYFQWIQDEHPLLPFVDVLNSLSVSDITRYKDSLQERKLSKLSIGSYIVVVRKFYEWAESKKWYPNIAKGIKTPPRKQEFRKEHLSESKSIELLQYYKKDRKRNKTQKTKKPISAEAVSRDYAIVNLMLLTGLRTIEVVRIDIGDITFKKEQRVLKVWGKGRMDKEDFVVLTDTTFRPIEQYIQKYRKDAREGDPLFVSLSPQNRGQRLTTRAINAICVDGLKKVNLWDETLKRHPFTPHSFRHTTAVAILKTQGSIADVQVVLRHSSINTSRIYTKSIEEELRLQNPIEYKLESYFK